MGQPALYDDDILLWSEEQAALIRRLGRTRRDLPNELDLENVAEEIESVGRSELASVESYIELILLHLIKLSTEPMSDAARHWRAELVGFHGNMKRRFAESMRQRIDLHDLWRLAREQAILASEHRDPPAELPESCPFDLDEILANRLDSPVLTERLKGIPSAAKDTTLR
jgi:hypothetical protein